MSAGSAAASLLASPNADPDAVEAALEAVVRDGAIDDFRKDFGPRRLMKLLGKGVLSERATDLADLLLEQAVDPSAGVGLVAEIDFSGVLHRDEMFPDEEVPLHGPPPPASDIREQNLLPLHLPLSQGGVAEFAADDCVAVFRDDLGDQAAAPAAGGGVTVCDGSDDETPPSLRLLNPPRRQRIGSELPMKIYPAAAMLARWLWRHRRLISGQTVLDIGSGVGTAGLAAAASGARRAVLTDISAPALKCAKENCVRNGPRVAAAARVAPLDWGAPPAVCPEEDEEGTATAGAAAAAAAVAADRDAQQRTQQQLDEEAEALLRRQFDVIIAADVINDVGLSELVYGEPPCPAPNRRVPTTDLPSRRVCTCECCRFACAGVIELYLKPHGVFLMLMPKSEHRYMIDRFRDMMCNSTNFDVAIADVPSWLHEGLGEVNMRLAEEAAVVKHELLVAQWKDGKRLKQP